MGRPIKKIFIGERVGSAGGEGVLQVDTTAGNSSGYSDFDPLVIDAPTIPGGIQAVGHVLSAAGAIDSAVITEAGSGYTSVPAVTAPAGTQGTGTFTAVLTTDGQEVIQSTAFITGGSNNAADMEAQKGSTTYRCTTSDGTEDCTLVNNTPSAGAEMAIPATDSAGGTYFVVKLYNNTVRVDPANGNGAQFTLGDKVEWAKDGVAVLNVSVKIT